MVAEVVHTGLLLTIGIICFFVLALIAILARFIDWSGLTSEWVCRKGLAIFSHLLGTRVRVSGRENMDPSKQYLIVVNHQSMLDILVMARILRVSFKFFAKHSLFNSPLLGWAMWASKQIPVERSSKTKSYRAIQKAIETLKTGKSSVLIFPEGTRMVQPGIGNFKNGFLHIVEATNIEILPVTMCGTLEMKKQGDFWFHPTTIYVTIHPAISVDASNRDRWPEYRETLQTTMRTEYARQQAIREREIQEQRDNKRKKKKVVAV